MFYVDECCSRGYLRTLMVLGYSFNVRDNRLEQGGLLQFASIPNNAYVAVDETTLSSRTPNKLTIDANTHAVTMTREGYHTWQKTVEVKPGTISWLSYTRLIPTELKAEKNHKPI